MLEAKNISKTFKRGWTGKTFKAVDDVSLQLVQGEWLALMGPSGCGKSSLARLLLRLIDADQGQIFFLGQEITNLKGRDLLPFRRKVQLISQRPEAFFDPSMKLLESVIEPLKIHGLYDKTRSRELLEEKLEKVKLNFSLLERYPHQVSGGEIQRLSICRALLLEPRILLLDEATSMLDISVQAQVLRILEDLQKTDKLTYLFISHDRQLVNLLADRLLEMKDGRIVRESIC